MGYFCKYAETVNKKKFPIFLRISKICSTFAARMAEKEVNMREQIVQTAEKMFAEVGIRSVSIDDICKRLGISKKTFYVYFEQKADLVDAVLEAHDNEKRVAATKWLASQPIEATLRSTVTQIQKIGKVKETPPMLYDLQKYYPACFERHKKRFEAAHRDMLVQYLHKGKAEGFFRAELEVDFCAEFLTRITIDMMADEPERKKDPKRVKLVRFMAETLMRGIVSPKGAEIIDNLDEGKRTKDRCAEGL